MAFGVTTLAVETSITGGAPAWIGVWRVVADVAWATGDALLSPVFGEDIGGFAT